MACYWRITLSFPDCRCNLKEYNEEEESLSAKNIENKEL
jgi:hypothetical protein